MSERPSAPLRTFLRDHVSSFEQLRVLLHLESGGEATAAEVAAKVGLPPELTEGALEELMQAGQLVRGVAPSGGHVHYSYAPSTSGLRALVSELARVYAETPLSVIRMMNENAVERLRSTAARRLAEAFRLDREKK